MKKIIFVSMFLCLLFMGACTKPEVTKEEAKRIGMARYAEFVKEQNWSPEHFEEPSLSYSAQAQAWDLTYETKEGYPKKTIDIIIGRYGRVEVSFED